MIKLTKEEYEALPPSMKKLFKADGDSYTFDTDPNKDKNDVAFNELKEEKRKLKEERDRLQKEKDDADHAKNKDKGDIDSINASWQKKLDKANADKDATISAREGSLRQLLVTNEAQRLANEISTMPHLLVPFIERRLAADFAEDGKATTRVLGNDGKLSALSLDEFKTEMLADKQYSGILKGSNASGGGASGGAGEGGAFNAKSYKNADGTTNWLKVHEDSKANPELLSQVKAFNADPSSAAQP